MQTTVEVQPVTIDLESFVMTALEGTNPDVNIGAAPDRDTAERMVLAAIAAKAPRPLTEFERSLIGVEVILGWRRRAEEHRAALADTQQALHAPLWGFR